MNKKELLQQALRLKFEQLDNFYQYEEISMLIEIAKENELDSDFILELEMDSNNIF
jgi:hypothetical protein